MLLSHFPGTMPRQPGSSLDELNQLNTAYFEGIYNQRPHSFLEGDSPIERFLRNHQLRFATEAQLEHIFLHEVKRSAPRMQPFPLTA
jgi:hypothetical protein